MRCLYFQGPKMKHTFASYPEMIFVDGSCCLHSSRAATYLIMVEDSERGNEIAVAGMFLNEAGENIHWL